MRESLHKGVTLAQMSPFSRWLMIKGFLGHKNSIDKGIERWKIYCLGTQSTRVGLKAKVQGKGEAKEVAEKRKKR